jgi:predicted dehydrogenase
MIVSKIRVGIIGCGEAAQILHLPSLYQLSDQFEVTAVCDASPSVTQAVANHWNIAKRFADEQELIAQDDVDAVVVASPNQYHARTTIRAAQAGKHVMVEKPMCMTLREADEVIATQKQTGVTVQVGYMRRYATAFVQACEMVREMQSIKLARVHDVIGANSQIIERTSRVIRGKDIPADLAAESNRLSSEAFREALGDNAPDGLVRTYGMLLGLASHDTSAMRELLGMPKGVLYAAYRHGGNYITTALDYGDYVCHVEIGVDSIARFDAYLLVYGQNKTVRVQYDTPYVRNLPTRLFVTDAVGSGGAASSEVNPSWGDNFTLEWQAFYDNVTQKKTPKSSPQDFRQDLELYADMVRLMA